MSWQTFSVQITAVNILDLRNKRKNKGYYVGIYIWGEKVHDIFIDKVLNFIYGQKNLNFIW